MNAVDIPLEDAPRPPVTRADVVAEVRTWIGTPYVHLHRMKGVAVDCVGVAIGVARNLGLVDPDFDITGYSRQPDGTMLDRCDEHMTRIEQADMLPGDGIVVAFDGDPQHFGILADYCHGGLAMVHATNKYGKVIETRLLFSAAPSGMKFVQAYRLPNVED